MSDGTTKNGAPVYQHEDGSYFLWFRDHNRGWALGRNYSSWAFVKGLVRILSYDFSTLGTINDQEATLCPEDIVTWQAWKGELREYVTEEDANSRCSDCEKYPALEECRKTDDRKFYISNLF